MLRALGYTALSRWHLNEGHASLLALELLDEQARRAVGRPSRTTTSRSSVSNACLLPIPRCPPAMISFHSTSWNACLAPALRFTMPEVFCCEGVLNATYLALNLSHYINGVAKKHGKSLGICLRTT